MTTDRSATPASRPCGRDAVPRLLRHGHGDGHRRHRLPPSRTSAGWRTACTRSPPPRTWCWPCLLIGPGWPDSRSSSPPTSPATPKASPSSPPSPAPTSSAASPAFVDGWWDAGLGPVVARASASGRCCVYTTLFAVVLERPTSPDWSGINGTWFLLTVSTESIVVLGALLLAVTPATCLASPSSRCSPSVSSCT